MEGQFESKIRRLFLAFSDTNKTVRKTSVKQLINLFEDPKNTFFQDSFLVQQLLGQHRKAIFYLFYDQADLTRQMSVKLTQIMLQRSAQTKQFLPYIYSVVIQRLNCEDMQGILSLPQVMRPTPGQKPHMLVKLNQKVEEVRNQLANMVDITIKDNQKDVLCGHLDAICDILRALAMDPLGDIQKKACQIVKLFCVKMGDMLMNFVQALARAVLLPLISKKSKIRLSALAALDAILQCGVWKKNAFVMQILVGYRDPNSIPIKAFFETTTIITDPNPLVRTGFMQYLNRWICILEDKYDHHPRLLPYLLSGLVDQNQNIKKIAFRTLQQIGHQIQTQKQKQFRQQIQYGVDAWWTDGQKLQARPCLGARFFVRGHIRKIWHALYKQLRDINQANRKRAANLVLLGIVYSQQYIVQYLDNLIPNLIPNLIDSTKQLKDIIKECFFYIGRYCNVSAYKHIFKSALKGEYVGEDTFLIASITALSQMISGSKYDQHFWQIIQLVIGQVSMQNSQSCLKMIQSIIKVLQKKQIQVTKEQYKKILWRLFISTFYQNYMHKTLLITLPLSQSNKKQLYQVLKSQAFQSLALLTKKQNITLPAFQNLQKHSFQSQGWKEIITMYMYAIKYQLNQQIQYIIKIFQKLLNQIMVPDPVDYILKLLLTFSEDYSQASTFVNIPVLISQFLIKFQPTKPKTAIQMLDATGQPTLPHKLYMSILNNNVKLVINLHKHNYFNNCNLALLYESTIKLAQKRFRRQPQGTSLIVKMHWAIVQQKGFKIIPQQNLNVQKVPITPMIIDYSMSVIQQSYNKAQPKIVLMAFQILKRLFETFPVVQRIDTSLPLHYLDYPSLIQKLFRYTLAQKNLQIKQKYIGLLAILCKKLMDWFKLQSKQAIQRRMFQRQALLDTLIKRVS